MSSTSTSQTAEREAPGSSVRSVNMTSGRTGRGTKKGKTMKKTSKTQKTTTETAAPPPVAQAPAQQPQPIGPSAKATLYRVQQLTKAAAQAVRRLAAAGRPTADALAAHMAEIDAAVAAYWQTQNTSTPTA